VLFVPKNKIKWSVIVRSLIGFLLSKKNITNAKIILQCEMQIMIFKKLYQKI
jgi:hypothetical protein